MMVFFPFNIFARSKKQLPQMNVINEKNKSRENTKSKEKGTKHNSKEKGTKHNARVYYVGKEDISKLDYINLEKLSHKSKYDCQVYLYFHKDFLYTSISILFFAYPSLRTSGTRSC